MPNKAETDHGTVLETDTYAAVWSPTEGYSFFTPKLADVMPAEALALGAALVRLENDPDFRNELIDWFKAQTQ